MLISPILRLARASGFSKQGPLQHDDDDEDEENTHLTKVIE